MVTTVTVSTLAETIARAIARFPRERGRIERGAALLALLALGHVAEYGPGAFTVRSQTNDGTTYVVSAGSYTDKAGGCSCVDAQRHPGQSCKHQWAVDIIQVAQERQRRLNAREREQAQRARFTADSVALAYAKAVRFAA